jgi:arylsulfatase A-like enzyme
MHYLHVMTQKMLRRFQAAFTSISFLFRCATGFSTMFFISPLLHAQSADRPNIILIVADDLGYSDVGFNGCQDIPTPNIDRIASQGVRFDAGYVCFSVCSPSRAGMLTGRYPQRFGYERNVLYIPDDPGMGLSREEELFPARLQQAGYRTTLLGKWHLGAHPELHPLKRGFSEWYGFLGGGHQFHPDSLRIKDPMQVNTEEGSYRTWMNRGLEPEKEAEYLTDALSREAVSFIERNSRQPFFLYLAYNAPHTPLQATADRLEKFKQIPDKQRRTYAAMVSAVDDGVGRVLETLDKLELASNTMVIFLSDNGGPLHHNGSRNGDLRGMKGTLFEGGIRVPFAIRWPGRIPAGSQFTKPVSSLDIAATVAGQVAGQPGPKYPLDGTDLIPFLTGKSKGAPHKYLFWRHFDQKSYVVLSGDHRKLLKRGDSTYLFNLAEDRRETIDLADKERRLLKKFNRERLKWDAQLKPPAFLGLSQRDEYMRTRQRK